MHRFTTTVRIAMSATVLLAVAVPATADVFHDYEDLAEGFLGETLVHSGVTYRDVNRVSGFFPDGEAFGPDDLGSQLIIERADLFYADFPGYGSPVNALTFGTAFIPGENLSIGALASVWMDLDEVGGSASLDLGYYENGPWGGISFVLDALLGGQVVASDSFVIADGGGHDNGAIRTMSVDGAAFDQLHLYAWLDGNYSGPRGMIDNLAVTAIPAPGVAGLLLVGGAACGVRRRRRRASRASVLSDGSGSA